MIYKGLLQYLLSTTFLAAIITFLLQYIKSLNFQIEHFLDYAIFQNDLIKFILFGLILSLVIFILSIILNLIYLPFSLNKSIFKETFLITERITDKIINYFTRNIYNTYFTKVSDILNR